MFDALVEQLAPHFTVIAYDQRDCGETETRRRRLRCRARTTTPRLDRGARPRDGPRVRHLVRRPLAQTFAHRSPQAVDRLVLGSTWPLPMRWPRSTGPASHADPGPARAPARLRQRRWPRYSCRRLSCRRTALLEGSFGSAQPRLRTRPRRRQRAVDGCLPARAGAIARAHAAHRRRARPGRAAAAHAGMAAAIAARASAAAARHRPRRRLQAPRRLVAGSRRSRSARRRIHHPARHDHE